MRPTTWPLSAAIALTCTFANAQTAAPITPLEKKMVVSVDAHNAEDRALLEKLVNINSGTMNLPGVVAVKDVIAPKFQALGFKVTWVPMDAIKRAGDLVAEHPCPAGDGKCGKRLLLIGHMDTVFEPSSPFQKYAPVGTDGKIVTGPGADDMKGGIVVMLAALRAMKEAGALDHAQITVVLSGDEERHGNPVSISRRDMIEAAKRSDVAFEFEPSGRFDGGKDSISVGRRSAGTWQLEVTGQSGHSSQVFGEKLGYGAIYEMARILDEFRRELPEEGLTYNVGLVLGGTTAERNADATGGTATGKSNIVPPITLVTGDIRTLNDEQTARTKAKMQAIVAKHLPKTDAKITFEEGYPAMAATPGNEALYQQWNGVSVALGLGPVLEEGPITRGGGDIAFVAQYLPGLVGTGILGEGPHAVGETVYIESIASQAKRNAVLMERLGLQPAGK
jgi:glutamate carboxypeptidase